MTTKRKIILTILLAVLVGGLVYELIQDFNSLSVYIKLLGEDRTDYRYSTYVKSLVQICVFIFVNIGATIISGLTIIKLYKK